MGRMNIANLRRGPQPLAPLTVAMGIPGCGKSYLCAGVKGSVFVGAEDGAPGLDIIAFPRCETIAEHFAAIDELQAHCADIKPSQLVFDSGTAFMRMAEQELCLKHGIATLQEMPYGKGPPHREEIARSLVARLDAFRRATGVPVVLVWHAKLETYADPEGEAYDRWVIDADPKHVAPVLMQGVDAVLFLKEEVSRRKLKEGMRERVVAKSYGDRTLYTCNGAAHTAKNRYGLPAELPADLNVYYQKIGEFFNRGES